MYHRPIILLQGRGPDPDADRERGRAVHGGLLPSRQHEDLRGQQLDHPGRGRPQGHLGNPGTALVPLAEADILSTQQHKDLRGQQLDHPDRGRRQDDQKKGQTLQILLKVVVFFPNSSTLVIPKKPR